MQAELQVLTQYVSYIDLLPEDTIKRWLDYE